MAADALRAAIGVNDVAIKNVAALAKTSYISGAVFLDVSVVIVVRTVFLEIAGTDIVVVVVLIAVAGIVATEVVQVVLLVALDGFAVDVAVLFVINEIAGTVVVDALVLLSLWLHTLLIVMRVFRYLFLML
ncbi:hypothetical protein BgiMline_004605 [Biomphalaria glabrata]|nr:hypothetical protein BgiMline_002713 [Biomphalaria glabrata]